VAGTTANTQTESAPATATWPKPMARKSATQAFTLSRSVAGLCLQPPPHTMPAAGLDRCSLAAMFAKLILAAGLSSSLFGSLPHGRNRVLQRREAAEQPAESSPRREPWVIGRRRKKPRQGRKNPALCRPCRGFPPSTVQPTAYAVGYSLPHLWCSGAQTEFPLPPVRLKKVEERACLKNFANTPVPDPVGSSARYDDLTPP
jgi:hypothetical protein